MKPPNHKWQELPDGNLRMITTLTHVDVEILIIPVAVKKPLSNSRVFLAIRNKESGDTAYWLDVDSGASSPKELSLSTALYRAEQFICSPTWLLKIGIDYYPEKPGWAKEAEKIRYRFGRP